MIISASYKTDIPAFYGEWFLRRLRAGYCKMVNPYGRQIYTVSLQREDVDGFVFWTKNLEPFVPALGVVRDLGFPFTVQYSINGYPRELESSVVDSHKTIAHMRMLAEEYGPRVAVWRYDTVVSTSLTPPQFHLDNFARLAEALRGATDEVVISFAHVYRKTRRNMDAAAEMHQFTWHDPDPAAKRALIHQLADIAKANGMDLNICAQPDLVLPGVAEPARCVDSRRLADVAGKPLETPVSGNRPGCLCSASRDIGDYDTCPHGCVYCYAVQNKALAQKRYKQHDVDGELLYEV